MLRTQELFPEPERSQIAVQLLRLDLDEALRLFQNSEDVRSSLLTLIDRGMCYQTYQASLSG